MKVPSSHIQARFSSTQTVKQSDRQLSSLLRVARGASLSRDEADAPVASTGVASCSSRSVRVARAVRAVRILADGSAVLVSNGSVLLQVHG